MGILGLDIPRKVLVAAIFTVSSGLTILLILRQPRLHLRLLRRRLSIETYFLGALLGPVLLLAAGALDYGQVLHGLRGSGGLHPLGILALFLSMVFMSVFLDVTGVFEYAARMALKMAHSDGRRLFFSLYLTVSVLTIFTSNDIVILTFTPFVYYFAREADMNPVPFLVAEFFAANTWSMMLYVGNPTNILIASAFGLEFVQYTAWMLLPTVAAGTVNAVALYLVFRREISRPMVRPEDIDPASAITDRRGALLGGVMLALCVVTLAAAPHFHLDMWPMAVCSALALAALLLMRDWFGAPSPEGAPALAGARSVRATLVRMPWTIVPFVLSLFVTVEALRVYGVTGDVGRFFNVAGTGDGTRTAFVYGIGSALSANALNNIPMTVAFTSVMDGLSGRQLLAAALGTAAGSNLGANITPIGALAGIMWMSILRRKGCGISFGRFVGYGLLVTPLSLAACLAALALEMRLFGALVG